MNSVLVVEDERKLNKMICDYLEAVGYSTASALDGLSALKIVRELEPDFLILDIMLPGIDGVTLLRKIREFSNVPIILLTARAQEADKLLGFELGADDYITKPFSLKELEARIRSISRRIGGIGESQTTILRSGALQMDLEKRLFSVDNSVIALTTTQFDLLRVFMTSPGKVFTRMELLDALMEHPHEGYERTVDAHIKNIRKCIEVDSSRPRHLITVWGLGYKLAESPQE